MSELSELQLVEVEEVDVMPPDKCIFEARDPGPVTDHVENKSTKKYMGPERRRENRRETTDRRGDVRFDLKASDRRENPGRREGDKTPKFW
ncbi:MAG: hypothetical protein OEV47_03135 [Gammaproteobacteria bacterium]|nr:hypothetical protein [Gammaproteobacteria bacterium]